MLIRDPGTDTFSFTFLFSLFRDLNFTFILKLFLVLLLRVLFFKVCVRFTFYIVFQFRFKNCSSFTFVSVSFHSASLSVSVCTFFRYDRRTAIKFGTHIQIDMRLIQTYKNWPHVWPGRLGSLGAISEIGLRRREKAFD